MIAPPATAITNTRSSSCSGIAAIVMFLMSRRTA